MPLLLYGLGCALVMVASLLFSGPDQWPMQGSRADELTNSIRAFDHGQQLLVGERPDGSLMPAGSKDDLGLFVIAPLLGKLIGSTDPTTIMRAMFAVFFLPAITLAPLLFRRITGSLVAALLIPLGMAVGLGTLIALSPVQLDIYWIAAWVTLGLLPIIFWIDGRWPRHAWAAFLAISLLAAVASSVRSQAGLPAALACLLVIATRAPWRIPGKVAVAACVLAVYLLAGTTAVSAIQDSRDRHAPESARASNVAPNHLFWHTAYLGFGYLPNDQGIWWFDGFADAAGRERDPNAGYGTVRYEHVMRTLTTDLVADHPLWAVGVMFKKFLVFLFLSVPFLLILLLTWPWAFRRHGALTRRITLLVAPTLIVSVIPPILAVPYPEYGFGWLSALFLLCLVSIGLVIADCTELASRRSISERLRSSTSCRRTIVWTSTGVIVLGAIAVSGYLIHSQASDWYTKRQQIQDKAVSQAAGDSRIDAGSAGWAAKLDLRMRCWSLICESESDRASAA